MVAEVSAHARLQLVDSLLVEPQVARRAHQGAAAFQVGEQVAEAIRRHAEPLGPLAGCRRFEPGFGRLLADPLDRLFGVSVECRREARRAHEVGVDEDLARLGESFERQIGGLRRDVLGQAAAQRAARHSRAQGFRGMERSERGDQRLLQLLERRGVDPQIARRVGRGTARRPDAAQCRIELRRIQSGLQQQLAASHTRQPGAGDAFAHPSDRVELCQDLELSQQGGVAAPSARRCDVEDHAATQCAPRAFPPREAARDEAVPRQQWDGLAVDVEPREAARTGLEALDPDRGEPRPTLGRAGEELDGDDAFLFAGAGEPVELQVCGEGGAESALARECLAARQIGDFHTLQVDRAARAGCDLIGELAVALQSADASRQAARMDFDRLADLERAAHERPRHHTAESPHGEYPVDRKAWRAGARRAGAALGQGFAQGVSQRVDPLTADRGHGDHLDVRERGRAEQVADLLGRQLADVVIRDVDLRQRHDAAVDPQQITDGDVLARLRHHALVGGDHQENQVDARGARDHGANQPLVARYIDDR